MPKSSLSGRSVEAIDCGSALEIGKRLAALCRNLDGGHIVDAGGHSCARCALSSSLPLVCRTDGAEGAGRWAIADRASVRLLAISHRMYRRGGHTIFQTSRTAHGLEISNAAPTSGDPDCKKERQ